LPSKKPHRPAAAFIFAISPRGRVLVHPRAGAVPGTLALPRRDWNKMLADFFSNYLLKKIHPVL
jgi:hypothetical protein